MESYVVWILLYAVGFGSISSIAIKKKNRDQLIWFFVGFFFGVFGFIAALLIEPLEDLEASTAISEDSYFDPAQQTKKCPDCAETIKLDAKLCRFCNRRFTEEEMIEQMNQAKNQFEESKKTGSRISRLEYL